MSSFVNKSGKKVAPKAPRRRVPAKSASVASQTPQPEPDTSQAAEVTQPAAQTTQPEIEVAQPTAALPKFLKAVADEIHQTPRPSKAPQADVDTSHPSQARQKSTPTSDAIQTPLPVVGAPATPVSLESSQPSRSQQRSQGHQLSEARVVRASLKVTQASESLIVVSSAPAPQISVVQESSRAARSPRATITDTDASRQTQRQAVVSTAPFVRASPKSAKRSKTASDTTNTMVGDQWQVTTQAELDARNSKSKVKLPVDPAQPIPGSAASRRLANAAKRKRKEIERNAAVNRLTGMATATAIDELVRESVEGREMNLEESSHRRPRASEEDENEDADPLAPQKKRRKPVREPTPDENESVTIAPGMTRMNDLARDMRVGRKSEREKMMRTIDWAEVKRRRKEDELRQALHRGRPDADADSAAAEREGAEEDLDEDERIERAFERNRRKGLNANLRIRLVGGEHVIDEQSQFVDRHAMVDEEIELLEEVEEDDLTKKFNVQTYVTWRRKDPAERILSHEKWTMDATDRFYDCLSQFGTDFMTISKMFPGRTRRHVKSKFVKEERADPERIKEALLGHLTRKRHGEGWNVTAFCEGSGIRESDLKDPKALAEELRVEREAMEREIEEAKKETEEMEFQMREAGLWPSDAEDENGNPLTPDEVLRKAAEKAAKLKRERQAKKRAKKHGPPTGGHEEIVETIEGDD
jgi:transcription factor TFIIIB component B''